MLHSECGSGRVSVGHQGEGRDATVMMAACAAGVKDAGDVLCPCGSLCICHFMHGRKGYQNYRENLHHQSAWVTQKYSESSLSVCVPV